MYAQDTSCSPDGSIADLAGRQHGVVARRQLEALGLSRTQVAHRLRTGRLLPLHRGVYAVGQAALRPEGRLLGAVLACGDRSVLSHRSAASMWGLAGGGARSVEVTVPGEHGRTVPGVVVHRSVVLPPDEVTVERAVPVTTPARTLLDLAGALPRVRLERAVERAEELRLFDLRAVEAALAAHPRRPGRRTLLEILRNWAPAPLTRSELERRFLALCAEAGVPAPQVNVRVGPYEVDFLWPGRRLIVETDGHATHGTRAAFERDRARDAWLQAAGWRVVRFTYRQVVAEAAVVAEVLRSLLRGA